MLFPVLKFLMNRQQEDFKNNDTENEKKKPNVIISALGLLFLIISTVLVVVPAILIARQCNPELKICQRFAQNKLNDVLRKALK